MEKTYELSGYTIRVHFSDGIVRIEENDALKGFLSKDMEARSTALVNSIKTDYSLFFKKELKVQNNSMLIEIWGHALASKFAEKLETNFHSRFVRNFATKVASRSDCIDSGELAKDPNRLLWDFLAVFKRFFLLFVPRKMRER